MVKKQITDWAGIVKEFQFIFIIFIWINTMLILEEGGFDWLWLGLFISTNLLVLVLLYMRNTKW